MVTPGGGYHKQLLSWTIQEKLVTNKVDKDFLTDLLGSRHFVRSAYGIELNSKETFRKVQKAIKRWPVMAKQQKRQFGLSETRPEAKRHLTFSLGSVRILDPIIMVIPCLISKVAALTERIESLSSLSSL